MSYRNRGFGLIEIMVGLAVGLVTTIVIMQVYSTFEGQKRATTSGDDAQTNGALALYAMEREIRAAGNGMTEGVPQKYPPLAGCTTHLYDQSHDFLIPNATPPFISNKQTANSDPTPVVRLAPVVVSDGGTLSDSVTIVYGTSSIVAPYTLASDYAPGATSIGLVSAAGIAKGDMVALIDRHPTATLSPSVNYITPAICSLLQVTDAPVGGVVPLTTGKYNIGNPAGVDTFSGDTAQLFNLGQLNIVTYRIANNNLVADISKFGVVPDGTATPATVTNRTDFAPLASNIVNMQVQYGVDISNPKGSVQTNCKMNTPGVSLASTDADAVVDEWVDATGDRWKNDGAGTPTLFDLRRVRAVRIGLVARSAVKASDKPDDPCNTQAVKIRWDSGPPMDPDLSADPKWTCYRYKVFQATIPVRNALWSSTMNPASSASCGLRDPA